MYVVVCALLLPMFFSTLQYFFENVPAYPLFILCLAFISLGLQGCDCLLFERMPPSDTEAHAYRESHPEFCMSEQYYRTLEMGKEDLSTLQQYSNDLHHLLNHKQGHGGAGGAGGAPSSTSQKQHAGEHAQKLSKDEVNAQLDSFKASHYYRNMGFLPPPPNHHHHHPHHQPQHPS